MILVIDFGTTNTVAVLGSGRQVTFDGEPWLPSAVFAGDDGLVIGADAVQLGRSAADRFEGTPKAKIGGGSAAGPVGDAVRAVLARGVAAARDQCGEPVTELVLTHPAGWDSAALGVLLGAADGLAPRVRPVPEPVAAATGQWLEIGQAVLVVDVGGGTSEVTVVRREPAGLAVVASAGPFAVGGDDLDQRIVERAQPSLRAPADAPRDRWLLRESARAAKELLSRHESAEIVLPDHRAVRLARAEFERLIAADIERIATLAGGVAGEVPVERVLLVGGTSRVPLLAKRLAEVIGRPVITDPEPETVVARGALQMVTADDSAPSPEGHLQGATRAEGHLQGVSGRGGIVALGLVLALAVAATVFFTGSRSTSSGRAVADRGVLAGPVVEAIMPAIPAGTEVVSSGEPAFTTVRVGAPVRYDGFSATLDVRLDGYQTATTAARGRGPDGFRWLKLEFRVANVDGADWRERFFDHVAAIDDRGQRLRSPGDAQVPCVGQRSVSAGVPAGEEVAVCGALPIPEATPVVAVHFAALRFPVFVPAATSEPAPANVIGKAGGPAAAVMSDGIPMHTKVELVLNPSGYFGAEVPEPGLRYVVVRMAITVTGHRDLIPAERPYLRDDRGAVLHDMGLMWQLPGCQQPLVAVSAGEPAWGCYVFEIDADVPITGVSHGIDPANFAEWPTWTVR